MATTVLDAILAANAARVGGDEGAAASLPGEALPFVISCMDPRIVGRLIPALGLAATPPPQAKFAGAVIRAGDHGAARSVLAAALFNVSTEVLVVGHTDCRMGRFSPGDVRGGLRRLGVPDAAFGGEDPAAWLGLFASERSSVQASVATLRADPRVPPGMPIHGLLFHLESGRLEVVVRGYDAVRTPAGAPAMPGGGLTAPPGPLGAPGPAGLGPVSMFGPGPVSLGVPPPMPVPTPAVAFPAPPPPTHAPPPPATFAAASDAAAPPPAAPPPLAAPPPPSPASEDSPSGPRRRGADSPFDRAREALDRLRRER